MESHGELFDDSETHEDLELHFWQRLVERVYDVCRTNGGLDDETCADIIEETERELSVRVSSDAWDTVEAFLTTASMYWLLGLDQDESERRLIDAYQRGSDDYIPNHDRPRRLFHPTD